MAGEAAEEILKAAGQKFDPSFEGRLKSNAANLQAAIDAFLKTEGSLHEISEISRDLVENLMTIHEQMEMLISPPEPPQPYTPTPYRSGFPPVPYPRRMSSR